MDEYKKRLVEELEEECRSNNGLVGSWKLLDITPALSKEALIGIISKLGKHDRFRQKSHEKDLDSLLSVCSKSPNPMFEIKIPSWGWFFYGLMAGVLLLHLGCTIVEMVLGF